jgi:hypothetical protein
LASWLLLIAVGRVGGGGVFSLGMVRAADDELKRLRSIESWMRTAAPAIASAKMSVLMTGDVVVTVSDDVTTILCGDLCDGEDQLKI